MTTACYSVGLLPIFTLAARSISQALATQDNARDYKQHQSWSVDILNYARSLLVVNKELRFVLYVYETMTARLTMVRSTETTALCYKLLDPPQALIEFEWCILTEQI